MDLKSQQFHKLWLKIAAIVFGAFGLVLFLGAVIATSEPARFSLDVLSWPLDRVQSYDAATTRFLSALTGGFLFGWGFTIWCLSGRVFDVAPEEVRRAVLFGLVAWFILDCAGSIASGNSSNAGFSPLVLLIAVGPMWFPARN